jgi:hypothetical protein
MKRKLDFAKCDLFNKVSKISDNVVVNNFIDEIIKNGRVTNFFCNENRYFFKNNDGGCISIYLNQNGIIVNSFLDGIDKVFQFDKSNDSSKIILNINTSINWPDHMEKRVVLFYTLYGSDGNLVSYQVVTDSSLIGNSDEVNDYLRSKVYDHYKVTSNVNVVDNKLVKVETIDYMYDYTKNSINYGICDKYDKFDSVVSFIEPKFYNVSEKDYNFVKNGAQKVKTML